MCQHWNFAASLQESFWKTMENLNLAMYATALAYGIFVQRCERQPDFCEAGTYPDSKGFSYRTHYVTATFAFVGAYIIAFCNYFEKSASKRESISVAHALFRFLVSKYNSV